MQPIKKNPRIWYRKRPIWKQRKKKIMREKITCEYCGKDAIGFQSMESAFAYVCEDHADTLLLALKPGEKKCSGSCVFERY